MDKKMAEESSESEISTNKENVVVKKTQQQKKPLSFKQPKAAPTKKPV